MTDPQNSSHDPQTNSLEDATFVTASTLLQVAQSIEASELTRMSLPQVQEAVEIVATMVPAGNVPAMILNGLQKLSSKKAQNDASRRDINALFHGVGQMLDKAVYGTVFAGPAAVIWGYQNLLKLAGKNPEDSFPEGTWQFYIDYALREDTARHANETHGFDSALYMAGLDLSLLDRMTAWAMTAIQMLHNYEAILENEWRERIQTHVLSMILFEGHPEMESHIPTLFRGWQAQLPYSLGQDAKPDETYIAYRQRKFDAFIRPHVRALNETRRNSWNMTVKTLKKSALPAYLQQMSIRATLRPDPYGEIRVPIEDKKLQIAVVYRGQYYLVPIWSDERPMDPVMLRALMTHIINAQPEQAAANLTLMASVKRAQNGRLREGFSAEVREDIEKLRLAPIILNFDPRPADVPVGEIRLAERGVGDHPLTIFDTGETLVFDQSHIFFDGAWGAAFAEIMTNEAIRNALWVQALPPSQAFGKPPRALNLHLDEQAIKRVRHAAHIVPEIDVENNHVDLRALLDLRNLFKQRNDLLRFTVNDILLLYRAIHAVTYQPEPRLAAYVRQNYGDIDALNPLENSPAILIPVDCSPRSPRDRLHPITFEVPLMELDILNKHQQALAALAQRDKDAEAFKAFNKALRDYFAALAGFGSIITQAKLIAAMGASDSVNTIKLLANLPRRMQRILDKIPHRFEVLNDLIKGREVFSNIGQVAPGSSLVRFIAAKDDNEKKTLAWGVLTDNHGKMHISLRDFRPHIRKMISQSDEDLAKALAQDYLDSYVAGLNVFVAQLAEITRAGRKRSPRRKSGTSTE